MSSSWDKDLIKVNEFVMFVDLEGLKVMASA